MSSSHSFELKISSLLASCVAVWCAFLYLAARPVSSLISEPARATSALLVAMREEVFESIIYCVFVLFFYSDICAANPPDLYMYILSTKLDGGQGNKTGLRCARHNDVVNSLNPVDILLAIPSDIGHYLESHISHIKLSGEGLFHHYSNV